MDTPENADERRADRLTREDCLSYVGIMRPNDYHFGIKLNNDLCIPVFKAGEVTLRPNSSINLNFTGGRPGASANLHGGINIDMGDDDTNFALNVDNLTFDNLRLATDKPYFSPGTWGFPDSITARVKTFEIALFDIHMARDSLESADGENCQLFFGARVSLDSKLDLDANGYFRMLGELRDGGNGKRWRYRALKVDAFSIKASTPAFAISAGFAAFGQQTESPKYGVGYYGHGSIFINALPSVGGVAVAAQFGSKDDRPYFFLDYLVNVAGLHIPVFPGLELGAMGGGFYFNMAPEESYLGLEPADINNKADYPMRRDSAFIAGTIDGERASRLPTNNVDKMLGLSLSGKKYVVTQKSFGLFSQVVLIAPSPNETSYNISGLIEMEVNAATMGVQYSITAAAKLMDEPNYTPDLKIEDGIGIYAEIAVVINGKNRESYFSAIAEVFINTANGAITGINDTLPEGDERRPQFVSENGFAGGLYLRFGTDKNYIWAGRPDAPLGVKFGGSSRRKKNHPGASAGAYFCIGNDIPPIPPLPRGVTNILGNISLSNTVNEDFAASLTGFAFGGKVELYGKGNFLIFGYDFYAGIGMDLNIRKYPDGSSCANIDTGGKFGIGGWYSQGQVYAGISGGLKVLGKPIAEAGIAAVLQFSGPRPIYAEGRLYGYYRIGNGRRRDLRLSAKFGEQCDIINGNGGTLIENLDLITDLLIDDGETGIDVGIRPAAGLGLGVNVATTLGNEEYRLRIIGHTLWDVEEFSTVAVLPDNDLEGAYFVERVPVNYLRGETLYEYSISVVAERKDGDGWVKVRDTSAQVTFTTGPSENRVDEENIDEAYPYDGMFNLYVEEQEIGVIDLFRGQPNVTSRPLRAYWSSPGGGRISSNAWSTGPNVIKFDIPPALVRGALYRLDLIEPVPIRDRPTLPAAVTDLLMESDAAPTLSPPGPDNGSPENSSGGQGTPVRDRSNAPIYTAYLRTSEYPTIADKLADVATRMRGGNDAIPRADLSDMEGFSIHETTYFNGGDAMISAYVGRQNDWPSEQLRDKYLDGPNLEAKNYMLGFSNYNSSAITIDLEAADLSMPYDGVNLRGGDNDNSIITSSTFAANATDSRFTDQYLEFSHPHTISQNLKILREEADRIPEQMEKVIFGERGASSSSMKCMTRAYKVLYETYTVPGPTVYREAITGTHVLSYTCYSSGENGLICDKKHTTPAGHYPGPPETRSRYVTTNRLIDFQEEGNPFTGEEFKRMDVNMRIWAVTNGIRVPQQTSGCPFNLPTRWAIKTPGDLSDDRLNYRGETFRVDFRYSPPGTYSRLRKVDISIR